MFSGAAYFNGALYYGAVGDSIKAFPIVNARIASTPSSKSTTTFPYPGSTPGISASGNSNGIVWAVENSNPAVLHAYNAANLGVECKLHAGGRWPRFIRGRQQIHHAYHRQRACLRRDADRCRGFCPDGAKAPPTNLRIIQ